MKIKRPPKATAGVLRSPDPMITAPTKLQHCRWFAGLGKVCTITGPAVAVAG
jgi:hypothetical protein